MKPYYLTGLVSIFSLMCATAQDFILDGVTVIKVHVNRPAGNVPVSISTFPVFPAFDHVKVSDSVSLTTNPIYLHCPARSLQEANLSINDKWIHLLLVPGDTISVEVDHSNADPGVVFGGRTKAIQQYYRLKAKQFPVSVTQQMMNAGGSGDLFRFKEEADSLAAQEHKFWNATVSRMSYLKVSAGSNLPESRMSVLQESDGAGLPEWFVRFETDAMRYKNAWMRMYMIPYLEFMQKKKMEVPEGYFDFLQELPLSNEAAMYDEAYQMFLLHYFDVKADRQPEKKREHGKEFLLADQLLEKRIAAFYKLRSISTALSSLPEDIPIELDRLPHDPLTEPVARYLRERAMAKMKHLDGEMAPNFYLEDVLDSLVSLRQYEGKVVYLSFWFAGCAPCIAEFPFENELVDDFKGKEVAVVSICTRTSKSKWLEMIDRHKLKTVNLFANKGWVDKLEKNYQIASYPHYVLIGRDGRVIRNHANRPREISGEIEKALGH